MSILTIRGHLDYGDEVIKILEMLGGINKFKTSAFKGDKFFFINTKRGNSIEKVKSMWEDCEYNKYDIYTLEKFLEKFPFKLNDEVLINNLNAKGIIIKMKWVDDEVVYTCISNNIEYICSIHDLTPITTLPTLNIKENDYPNTFQKCYEILFPNNKFENDISIEGVSKEYTKHFISLIKLKICRDAYWKILNYNEKEKCKFNISITHNNVFSYDKWNNDFFLRFPNRCARIAFMENFKQLIIDCKNLLI